jgi:DNA-3-methyladenine glycosylase I
VIEAKWPGFLEAFNDFDPQIVAGYTPADVENLLADPGIIRNRRKIEATVHNAGEMLRLEREHGTFAAYLRSHGSYDATVRDLRRNFKFLGESGAYHFLYVVGEKVPDHDCWMKDHPASAT